MTDFNHGSHCSSKETDFYTNKTTNGIGTQCKLTMEFKSNLNRPK